MTRCCVTAVLVFLAVRANNFIFQDEEVHPLQKLVDENRNTADKLMTDMASRWELAKQSMADTQILREAYIPDNLVVRGYVDESVFTRMSSWNVVPGDNIPSKRLFIVNIFHSLAIRVNTIWNEDDKYFGVPYPLKEDEE